MTLENANRIDGDTRLVGLIGWPSEPWPSPTIYNTAFETLGLNWRYVPLSVPQGRLREALLGLRALGFAGAEVTGLYSGDALNHLEQLSPAARMIGTINILQVDEHGRLVGDNTRWLGFLATVRTRVPTLNGLRPLIIGAGEAAESIVYALTREGLPLTIVDERIERAIDLVHRLRHVLDEHSFSVYRWPQDLERVAPETNLIVNTTELGTWPDIDHSPWPDGLSFPTGALVFDLASRASETLFLRQARANGAETVGGLWLRVHEAVVALQRWTGRPVPIEVMWRVAEGVLIPSTSRQLPWPGDV
jgi:shikimate dehydrogenase